MSKGIAFYRILHTLLSIAFLFILHLVLEAIGDVEGDIVDAENESISISIGGADSSGEESLSNKVGSGKGMGDLWGVDVDGVNKVEVTGSGSDDAMLKYDDPGYVDEVQLEISGFLCNGRYWFCLVFKYNLMSPPMVIIVKIIAHIHKPKKKV